MLIRGERFVILFECDGVGELFICSQLHLIQDARIDLAGVVDVKLRAGRNCGGGVIFNPFEFKRYVLTAYAASNLPLVTGNPNAFIRNIPIFINQQSLIVKFQFFQAYTIRQGIRHGQRCGICIGTHTNLPGQHTVLCGKGDGFLVAVAVCLIDAGLFVIITGCAFLFRSVRRLDGDGVLILLRVRHGAHIGVSLVLKPDFLAAIVFKHVTVEYNLIACELFVLYTGPGYDV